MAKTTGPLLSLDAHGSLSKLLTYSNKRTGQQVRKYNKPLVTPSAKQRGQRRLTEFLVAQWQGMSAATKLTWETAAKASGRNLPGYQYFLSKAQKDLYTHHGLCGYWHCNEIVAGQILDLSGNGIHGDLKPTPGSNAPLISASKKPRFGNGLLYDGTDEYVNLGDNAILNPLTRITIEFLIKPTIIDSSARIILAFGYHFANKRGLEAEITTGDRFAFRIGDGANFVLCSANVDAIQNSWYLIMLTWDGTTAKLHINNVTQADTEAFGGPIEYEVVIDRIGGAGAAFFGGIIDEFCIYNRYLSDAERTARWNFIRELMA